MSSFFYIILLILWYLNSYDFRKGIDGISALCRRKLAVDPFSGCVFVFTNKRRTAIKILVYDGQGFWLCMKRFSKGRLKWWPTYQGTSISNSSIMQVQTILYQGIPSDNQYGSAFKPLPRSPVALDSSKAASSLGV